MNNRSIIITASVALTFLVVLAVISALSFFPNTSEKPPAESTTSKLPLFGSKVSTNPVASGGLDKAVTVSAGMVEVPTATGNIIVKDFTETPGVTRESYVDNFYILYPVDEREELEYEINYLASDRSFLVVIAKEPIGEIRKAAAEDLKNRLGISDSELCTLITEVRVPWWVNFSYADKNLGFPNCPGAVKFAGD